MASASDPVMAYAECRRSLERCLCFGGNIQNGKGKSQGFIEEIHGERLSNCVACVVERVWGDAESENVSEAG